jgi:hypothetical protein
MYNNYKHTHSTVILYIEVYFARMQTEFAKFSSNTQKVEQAGVSLFSVNSSGGQPETYSGTFFWWG